MNKKEVYEIAVDEYRLRIRRALAIKWNEFQSNIAKEANRQYRLSRRKYKPYQLKESSDKRIPVNA